MFSFIIIPAVTNLAGTILKPRKGGYPVFEPRAKVRGEAKRSTEMTPKSAAK